MDRKKNLAILEDDPAILEIFKRVLRNDAEVYTCGSVADFENILSKTEMDLFVIDLALGDKKDGLQVIQELRASDKYKSTPIIVVTAHAFHSDENNAVAAGANRFLRKPVENIVLLHTVKDLLSLE